MKVENGRTIYEEGNFDNAFLYGFVCCLVLGLPLFFVCSDERAIVVGWFIGVGIYIVRWVFGRFLTTNGGKNEREVIY